VRQMTPGMQVSLDDGRPLGTVPAAGTLSAELQPGSHTLRFTRSGYQSKSGTRQFFAGETVTLTGADVEMVPELATLEVEADANVTVVVLKDNVNVVQPF